MDYERLFVEHLFLRVPAQQYVGQFLATFKEYPPRRKPGGFSLDRVLESLQEGASKQAATTAVSRLDTPQRVVFAGPSSQIEASRVDCSAVWMLRSCIPNRTVRRGPAHG
jgi:hypothetical protein